MVLNTDCVVLALRFVIGLPLDFDHFALRFSPTLPFLSDPGVPGVRSMGPVLSNKLTELPFADLTDVTLADEDNNSILTDNANRAIHGNVAMYVTLPGGQL